ncbi:MAG: right-handed parallel beta-helix repeat-containing protein, partial [Candidatus Thermoplasmatota archaeon]|nr:right-handed parallel beta-helix repeat-containing protein [Candidatus Thermoplasmatota archaeon]MBU1940812.1 right-handed parallel beta-helix repeat-containing protein [Candidatus Thermoplasmatota archaeon]
IRLIGENKSTTIIDGGSKGTVVEITSQGWGNISDFTIQNSGDMGEPDFDAGIKVYSDDNIFHDLIISNNCYGVVLWYVNNILVNNSDLMLNGGCGLFQFLCDEIIVMNNRFSYNEYAVRLKGSTSGLIKNNILVDNNKGLQLCCGSRLNVIFRNSFINNSVYHASDESVDNVWYNYSMGNYWDNYGGVDTDLNGIGDSPYNISGTVSQQDRYPLMFPLFENYL